MSSSKPTMDSNPETPGQHKSVIFVIAGLALIVLIGVILLRKSHSPAAETSGPVTVGVAKVTRADLFNELPIPADFRPYVEVELHAKVAGYVNQMNVDFGDKVKAGQLLATLEVPELFDQLHNAIAMQQKAEADYTNALLLFDRLKTVNEQHPNLVAQQELDDAHAKEATSKAAIAAARAEVERFQTLTNYTRILAPFDGVVTKRYVDPGALIQSGISSETQSLPLVRVSDNYHLRLDFPVSVEYVKDIHLGEPVEVVVQSLGGKTFSGDISRFSDKVSEDTRTMTVEVEVANPNLEIVPGMYAAVQLKTQKRPQVLSVPIQAVAGGKEPSVYVVNQNSEIEPRKVTVGVETPDRCEIISGLKEGEWVMIGNRAFVQPGQKVETKLISEPALP